MKGTIFDIQHFSVHDGPGIRSTVFLKGCQLRCLWCHNPESILIRPRELSFVARNCLGCASCVQVCKNGVHVMAGGEHRLNRDVCIRCGECTKNCPSKALSLCGRQVEAAEVIEEVLRDKAYYRDDGGMTISGGEPLVQREFAAELARLGNEAGINVALETNLCYPYTWLDDIKKYIGLFLADWKETDLAKHTEYTGVGNEELLQNIGRLHDEGFAVLLRCPIIPGYNDREDHFTKIAELTLEMPNLLGAEILPYHNLGVSKNERFGLEREIKTIKAEQPDAETVEGWISFIRSRGGRLVNE